jgi:hypothetical protein
MISIDFLDFPVCSKATVESGGSKKGGRVKERGRKEGKMGRKEVSLGEGGGAVCIGFFTRIRIWLSKKILQ